MFPQCRFSHWTTTKGKRPASGYSKQYTDRPRVGVLTRSWCISQKNKVGFEQMLKLLMNLLIFAMVNTIPWKGGQSIITLSPNDQNSSLVCTCSILVALSPPLNVQNVTPTPPPTSGNQLHKYHKICFPECFSCPPIHMVSMI